MQNKKTIMTFSAFFILIFHLWIYVTNFQLEIYLRQICVIGVDLFFFVSAYSISKRANVEYKKFIFDRFKKIYLKFVIFAIMGAIYLKWSMSKLVKIILGIELITRGGGSFLWFIPGIMLVYLILPLYKKIDESHPKITPIIVILGYTLVTIIISIFTNYNNLFILTNRIPVILLGYYFAKYGIFECLNESKVRYWLVTILLLIFGILISYLVFISHFNVLWFKELFYILYIPLVMGILLLLDKIKNNKVSALIGTITLELYGIQMLFGFKIANIVFKITNIKLISNILVVLSLIIIAIVLKKIFDLLYTFASNIKS